MFGKKKKKIKEQSYTKPLQTLWFFVTKEIFHYFSPVHLSLSFSPLFYLLACLLACRHALRVFHLFFPFFPSFLLENIFALKGEHLLLPESSFSVNYNSSR